MIYKKNCLSQKFILIAGVDESGCGSLIGSVVAAAVIFDPLHTQLMPELADSKTLNIKKRLVLYKDIMKHALTWSLGYASSKEIDRFNILQARLLAIKRAVYSLSIKPDLVLIDGNQAPNLGDISYQCLIKGDKTIPIISAASIIAKVTRDHDISILHDLYPKYGLIQHKGYPTKLHLKRLYMHGPTIYHRNSFSPIKYMV